MEDQKLIATIHTTKDTDREVWKQVLELNQSRHIRPQYNYLPPPEDGEPSSNTAGDICLQLNFDNGPRTNLGLILGSSPDCDIALPKLSGISPHHGAFTFDAQRHLIYRDFGFSCGSEVTYSTAGQGWRSNFSWIIGGYEQLEKEKEIIIQLGLEFRLQIVTHYKYYSLSSFTKNVHRFRQGSPEPEIRISTLNLHTLGSRPITLQRKLRSGSSGMVNYAWDVSSGDEYAIKQPLDSAIRHGKHKANLWVDEDRIMRKVSHPHILELLYSEFEPAIRFHLQYMAKGTLWKRKISPKKSFQVLQQSLSALDYLHGLDPPITHRDISSSNMLIQSEGEEVIHVKLADFGLATEDSDMSRDCGTPGYIAPEIIQLRDRSARGRTYTSKVDVWSLGVVVYHLLYNYPEYKGGDADYDAKRCQIIANETQRQYGFDKSRINYLLSLMLVIDSCKRKSAHEGYQLSTRAAPAETELQTSLIQNSPNQNQSNTFDGDKSTVRQEDQSTICQERQSINPPQIRQRTPRPPISNFFTSLGLSSSSASTVANKYGVKKASNANGPRASRQRQRRINARLPSNLPRTESESTAEPVSYNHALGQLINDPLCSLGGGSELASTIRRDYPGSCDTRSSLSFGTPMRSAYDEPSQELGVDPPKTQNHGSIDGQQQDAEGYTPDEYMGAELLCGLRAMDSH